MFKQWWLAKISLQLPKKLVLVTCLVQFSSENKKQSNPRPMVNLFLIEFHWSEQGSRSIVFSSLVDVKVFSRKQMLLTIYRMPIALCDSSLLPPPPPNTTILPRTCLMVQIGDMQMWHPWSGLSRRQLQRTFLAQTL